MRQIIRCIFLVGGCGTSHHLINGAFVVVETLFEFLSIGIIILLKHEHGPAVLVVQVFLVILAASDLILPGDEEELVIHILASGTELLQIEEEMQGNVLMDPDSFCNPPKEPQEIDGVTQPEDPNDNRP